MARPPASACCSRPAPSRARSARCSRPPRCRCSPSVFTDRDERAKAFGIFGAIAAGGGAVGLLLGGVLTEYLDWRWCLYVNIVIAVITGIGIQLLVTDSRAAVGRPRFDLPGVGLIVVSLLSIVYGCSRAETDGWHSGPVIGLLVLGGILLAAFVAVESRVTQPLLPLRIVLDRARGSAYIAVALSVVAMFGMFLFFTYEMQIVSNYSAVLTGVAFLPMTGAILVSAGGIASRLIAHVPPRALIVPGLLITAAGLFVASRIEVGTSYAAGILPAELLIGFGMGWVMAPSMNYATHRVPEQDAGVASATVNTSQQVGASIGTALLNTIAASATASYIAAHIPYGAGPKPPPGAAAAAMARIKSAGLVHGFQQGFIAATIIVAAAAVIVAVLMNTPRPDQEDAVTAPAG